jgi:hypothetical protein
MPIFEKIISFIPKSYDIRPAPAIFEAKKTTDSSLYISSNFSLLCSNCKKQISEDSSQIKCEGGHVCCNACFQTAVGFSIKLKTNIVPCGVTGCENNYSEETVSDNISGTLYKRLSSFTTSVSQITPFILYYYPKQIIISS